MVEGLLYGLCAEDVGPARNTNEAQQRRRGELAEGLGLDWDRVAIAGAVHGADVGSADEGQGLVEGVDGLVTSRAGVGLFAVFADCCPIVLYDPRRRVLALVHAGWRGTVAGVASNALSSLGQRYGTEPEGVVAILGPSICGRCYEVGDEVAGQFPAEAVSQDTGRRSVDLVRANLHQLVAAGVSAERVVIDGRCTFETAELPSHRRRADGRRFGVLAALEP